MMNPSSLRMAFALFCICVAPFTCYAQNTPNPNSGTTVTQTNVTDSQAATGNGEWGSSRLNAHDRVVVQAPEATSAQGTYGVCKSILSNDSRDIFVPWNNRGEWSNFLQAVTSGSLANYSVSSCCAPQTASVCGTDTGVQLGYRRLGTVLDSKASTGKPLDPTLKTAYDQDQTYLQHFAGQGDVYGPVYASQVTGNTSIDYEVTYVCENTNWVKTHEIGSCVPLNGACNSPGTITSLPSDLQTLCGAGSIFQNLQTNSNGYTWECAGTPGMSTALCQAYTNPPMNGSCGPNASPNPTTYTQAQMLSMSPSLLCYTGTFNGSIDNENYNLPYWVYECNGENGGYSVQCYAMSTEVNGVCGTDNGQTYPGNQAPPAHQYCLWYEMAPTNLVLNSTTNTWTWTCAGLNGGTSQDCSANSNPDWGAGVCGSDAGGYFPDGTLFASDPNLCSGGTVGNFSGSTGNAPHYWQWSCTGTLNGNPVTTWCTADDTSLAGVCGTDNGQNFSALNINDPNLCAVGIAQNFIISDTDPASAWGWECAGTGGNNTAICNASNLAQNTDGACGSAEGVPTLVAPSSGLCTAGTWTSVTADGTNSNWIWTCQGIGTGSSASCSAPIQAPQANGVCGPTNGTAIPNTPNFNMCSSGVVQNFSGTGPWTWTCSGTGTGPTTSQTCMAYLCQACTGTVTTSKTGSLETSIGACTASGTPSWTETDSLISGSANSGTLQWTDPMSVYNQTVNSSTAPWPTYCSPCYQQIQSVSNVQITVQHASSGCPFHTGDVLTPAAPPIVTVP